MLSEITIPQEALVTFCEKHYIKRLLLFGSVLRDDFAASSDIDVLVEFVPEHIPGFLRFSAMQRELSHLLQRDVDLNTYHSLSCYFRQAVLETAQVIYEKDT